MTTAELERIARDVVPPVGKTGWRATVLEPHVHAVVPIIAGRLDGKPVWRGAQRDLFRLMDLLEGRTPASRRAPRESAGGSLGAPVVSEELTEAPVADASSGKDPVRPCAGCDEPLPADARPNRRTHNGACRQRAQYRRTHADAGAGADSRTHDLTLSDRSSDGPIPATRSALEADPAGSNGHKPEPDPRGLSGSSADRSDGSSTDVGPFSSGGPTSGTTSTGQPASSANALAGIEGAGQLALPLSG